MKINKILAAGVAATLAVTSLSAVASAETKTYTWKMDYTQSKVQWNNQKIAYLDDNSYIKAEAGSDVLTKTMLDDASALAKTTVAASIAIYDGTKNFVEKKGNGAASYAADAAAALTVDDVPKTISNLDTVASANMKLLKSMSDSLEITSNPATHTIKAQDAISDAKKLVDAAKEAKKALTEINTLLEADSKLATPTMVSAAGYAKIAGSATTFNADGSVKVAGDKGTLDAIAYCEQVITELEKAIVNAEDALNGLPLLEDNEIGGIVLSKVPVKATKYTAFRDYWKEVPGGFADDMYIQLDSAKVEIVGTKRGSTATETVTKDFAKAYTGFDVNHYGTTEDKNHIQVTFAPKYVNRDGFINLNVFGTITDVRITASFKIVKLKDGKTVANNDHLNADNFEDYYLFQEADYKLYEGITLKSLSENFKGLVSYFETFTDPDAFNPSTAAANLVTFDKLVYTDRNLYKMYKGLKNSAPTGNAHDNSDSKKTLKPFLKMTTDAEGQTIVRNKVNVLSYTDDYESQTISEKRDGKTQTYDDAGMGTQPKWFAGLASQAADFFNKQNNGQMIFKFADPANPSLWVSYGIPSTEVGLRTLQGTAMALFFNYKTSTGSISSIGVVDKDAWTITFDMATVLDDFGGLTKATLEDIYYGLNTGLQYGDPYNGKGYVVETVTFQYDDAPTAVDASTDDDAAVVVADDDDDVVADDDDDDIFADDDVVADDDDDDDDAGIIEDDDDDDTDVNNDVDYVDGADDDANPGTGVGLAVIPAIVAAAAAIVSKKRK